MSDETAKITKRLGISLDVFEDLIAKGVFDPKRGRPKGRKADKTFEIIEACREICKEVSPITIRGICYKLLSRGLIYSMKEANTISKLTTTAREDGSLDWRLIVDDQRQLEAPLVWKNIPGFLNSVRHWYEKDLWETQPHKIEVWSEKATVAGVLRPVLREFRVGLLCMKGNASFTAVKTACEERSGMTVLYVGDVDPSGMHMSEEDLPGRIQRYGGDIKIKRIALIKGRDTDSLPGLEIPVPKEGKKPNPLLPWYLENYGNEFWELDAMDPEDLRNRVREEIESYIDWELWEEAKEQEEEDKERIQHLIRDLPGAGWVEEDED